jgi:predicted cupin superfamily sugar epimerase
VRPSPDEIKRLLELEPHPTCGFVRETFRSGETVPEGALPGFGGSRPRGSVLTFLVTPDARMALHRIRPDQMYHHYLGDPLEVLLLYPDGRGAVETIGPDLDAGMRPQLLIPGETWHVSRVRPGGEYALLATSEWPGVEPPDVELGDPARLAKRYPDVAPRISEFVPAGESEPLRLARTA